MSIPPLLSFLLLLFLVTAPHAHAQRSSPPSPDGDNGSNDNVAAPYSTNLNAATAILIIVLIAAFFFLAFFSVYFHRCCWRELRSASSVTPAAPGAVTASRRGARRGLDPAVLETFPTLSYAEVAKLKIGEDSLECAVCLTEFCDDEALRMLPKCCHVFHPECIDTWLESHVTCPVCRADLSAVPASGIPGQDHPEESEQPCEEEGQGGGEGDGSGQVAIDMERVGRSRTVGHVDRFTLRLPEQVRREIVAAGALRRSASMAVFRSGGEGSTRRGYRRGRSMRSGGGLSERWTAGILARVATWRRGEAAEGSSAKLGVFHCMSGGGGGGDGEKGEASSSVSAAEVVVGKV